MPSRAAGQRQPLTTTTPERETDQPPWTCPECGFRNRGTREWCQRCSEPKPLPAPQHPLALIAWHDALIWAVKNPKILAAFQLETGAAIPAPCGGILAMIDKACGLDLDEVFAEKFIAWFNENIWGVENGKPVDFGGEVPAASESEGAA
jgi:hypothetical protein